MAMHKQVGTSNHHEVVFMCHQYIWFVLHRGATAVLLPAAPVAILLLAHHALGLGRQLIVLHAHLQHTKCNVVLITSYAARAGGHITST